MSTFYIARALLMETVLKMKKENNQTTFLGTEEVPGVVVLLDYNLNSQHQASTNDSN